MFRMLCNVAYSSLKCLLFHINTQNILLLKSLGSVSHLGKKNLNSFTILLYFYHINAALVSIRDFKNI